MYILQHVGLFLKIYNENNFLLIQKLVLQPHQFLFLSGIFLSYWMDYVIDTNFLCLLY